MSVTSGFFNSLNGDRLYNAEQMSAIFDGVINDGVFSNIGTNFIVKASSGLVVTVGIGRAWFNSTWLLNDAILPLTAGPSEVVLNRYDAVVIEINHSESVRAGSIKIIEGTPASSPKYPTMTKTSEVNQYPLAYIYREAGSTAIAQADIKSMIGTKSCPFITGILETASIDSMVAQWQSQWTRWYSKQTESVLNQFNQWRDSVQTDFYTWYNDLQVVLDGDVATKLSKEILELQNKFGTLAEEYCIYQTVFDSDNSVIEDSYGTQVEGKIVYKIS